MLEPKATFANRTVGEWLVAMPTFLIMLVVIFLGIGEYVHGQLLRIGESQWEQYFILRADIPAPTCNPDLDIAAEVERRIAEARVEAAAEIDLLRESVDPDAIRQSVERSRAMCREQWSIVQQNRDRVTTGVRAYRFVETGVARLVHFVGQYKQLLLCWLILICATTTTLTRHHIGLRGIQTRTDYYVATTMQFAAHAMLLFSELYYRGAEQQAMAEGVGVQLFHLHIWWAAGFGLLTLASGYQLLKPPRSFAPGGNIGHALLTIPLYAYMAVIASLQFWIVPAATQLVGGDVAGAPYYQGIGVYLAQLTELSGMFLALALHIWIGMLLKQTRAAELFFDVIRPWKLSPELMCFVAVAIAAWPTAYTAASGIFVIAAGTLVYQELLRSQARRGLALAATAMSGSLGVVLSPCLLVVIVAALDRRVTTDEMFHHGFSVYLMTVALFLLVAHLSRTKPVHIAPVSVALPEMVRRIGPLIPYIVIITATIGLCTRIFNQPFNEFSAPYILPLLLIAILAYEKTSVWVAHLASSLVLLGVTFACYQWAMAPDGASSVALGANVIGYAIAAGLAVASFKHARAWNRDRPPAPADQGKRPLAWALRAATNETTGHTGAILMLMALSVSIGGMVERSHVMDLFPQIDSIWWTMTVLVIVEVFIGMVMDPYGAVILVNATLAPIAFQAGIEPLHFWMLTLLSFELGYLTPPVALNHLLTRLLLGDQQIQLAAAEARAAGRGWWYVHERYLLPVTVMLIALLIVAYGPLAWQQFGWGHYLPGWVNAWLTYTR